MFIFLPVQYLCDFLGYNHLYELSDGMSLAGFRRLYFTVDNMYMPAALDFACHERTRNEQSGNYELSTATFDKCLSCFSRTYPEWRNIASELRLIPCMQRVSI